MKPACIHIVSCIFTSFITIKYFCSKNKFFNPQVSCKVTKNGELVGLCLNKIDYLDETKRIPSFAEAVEGRDIFMNKILEFMDVLYKVCFQNN